MNESEQQNTNETPAKEDKKEGIFSLMEEVLRFSLIALLFIVPIRIFIAQPYIVSGASMYPTFENGEYLIVDQLTYRFNEPGRGDVIIFRFPEDTSKFFIKRVIGLPGESISFEDGVFYVTEKTGTKHSFGEPYLKQKFQGTFSVKLKDDEYFVMGDNRSASLDSRIFGAIKKDHIVGRAMLRLLPPTKADIFPGFHKFVQ